MQLGFFNNMTKRERYAVYSAVALILVFISIQFIITPYLDRKDNLKRRYIQKTKDLEEMLVLSSEYEVLNRTIDLSAEDFKNREKGFTLFSFLDRLSGETGIKEHITYMKPSSSVSRSGAYRIYQVELKLLAVNLKQLTDYLYGIETSKNVLFVKRLTIDQSSKPEGYIDAVMLIETYEMI